MRQIWVWSAFGCRCNSFTFVISVAAAFSVPELDYKKVCQNMKIWWQIMDFVTAMQNSQETTPKPTIRLEFPSPHFTTGLSRLLVCCSSKQPTARIWPLSWSLMSHPHMHTGMPAGNSVSFSLSALNTCVAFSWWIFQGYTSVREPTMGLDFSSK